MVEEESRSLTQPRVLQAPAAGVAAGAAGPVVRRRLRPGSVATSIRAAIRVRDPVKALRSRARRADRRRPKSAGQLPCPRPQPESSQTTAPHDELVSVVRGLVEAAPKRSVSIDAVANALKSRGFQRSPGSPRLVTRLRRIKELLVSPSGTITLAEDGAPPRAIRRWRASRSRGRADGPRADGRSCRVAARWPAVEARPWPRPPRSTRSSTTTVSRTSSAGRTASPSA